MMAKFVFVIDFEFCWVFGAEAVGIFRTFTILYFGVVLQGGAVCALVWLVRESTHQCRMCTRIEFGTHGVRDQNTSKGGR